MRIFATLILISFFLNPIFSQDFEKPIDYVQFFNAEFLHMQQLQVEYSSFLVHTRAEVADKKRRRLMSSVKASLRKFDAVKKFKDDKGLKIHAVKTLEIMLEIAEKDYLALAEEKVGCEDCFTALEIEAVLTTQDFTKISESMKNVFKSIKDFAKANNITLNVYETEHNELIGKINKINAFTRQTDLAALEVQYADKAIIHALNEKDSKKATEELKNMHKAIANATKRLKKAGKIKDDQACLEKAEHLVAFFKDAAKDLYPLMIQTFDEDGKVVNEYVKQYNTSINALNEGALKVDNAYQDAKERLEKKYIPNPLGPVGP